MTPVRTLLIALALALVPAAGGTPAAASIPPEFVAVTRYDDPSAEDFERMSEAVGTYQSNLYWPAVEQFEPGDRDWSRYDAMFEAAAASGIRIRPRIYGSPGWAAALPHHPPDPEHHDEFTRFLEATVSRYGPSGTFWAEHPELEPLPARAWQIWNEPNNPDFWLPEPAASQYVGLLAAAERAIHRADPAAEVIGGELFPTPYREGGIPMAAYLADLYALGGGEYLDGVGVHPYAGNPERAFEIVAQARAIMDRNGDAGKPIWITELGWATGGDASTVTVSEEVQADYLRRSIVLADARRGRLRLAGMTWFSLEDQAGANWPERTGLWRQDGSAKPSWRVLVEAAGRGWDSRLVAAARRLGEQLLAAARRL